MQSGNWNVSDGWNPCSVNDDINALHGIDSQDQEEKTENKGWGHPGPQNGSWEDPDASFMRDQEEEPEFNTSSCSDQDPPEVSVPLESLENEYVESDGTVRDYNRNIIGRLVQGDAWEFSEQCYSCDSRGNVIDWCGWPVGKVKTIDPFVPVDLPLPLSVLQGLAVEANGEVFNPLTGTALGHVVEKSAGVTLESCHCDARGNFLDNGGQVKGKVTTVSQEASRWLQGSARVERGALKEHDIGMIMGMTDYNRELVAVMLMNPESEAAKTLTAMLPPREAGEDKDSPVSW